MTDRILIVDDEQDICMLLESVLRDEGYEPMSVQTDEAALEKIRTDRPTLVVLDIWLEGSRKDGLQILEQIRRENSTLPVIMISGHGTIEAAVTAIKRGAYDFIEKPFQTERLLLIVERALRDAKLRQEIEDLKLHGGKETELTGESLAIQSVFSAIDRVAGTNCRMLINGPSGSGKEVTARMIHNKSLRAGAPFVSFRPGAYRSDQQAVELFGVEPSKSNGGVDRKIGVLERANGGTLFLDEIAEMNSELQAKVLRVLQTESFKRIGGSDAIPLNVRVISSTNRDLDEMIAAGKFSEDLYTRLNVSKITMPSLTKRRADIPMLAKYFLKKAALSSGLPSRSLSAETLAALQSYEWPGNIRQLRNVIEWLLIMAPGSAHEPIRAEHLPSQLSATQPEESISETPSAEIFDKPLREAREIFERDYLTMQVRRFGGNISKTATFIGMERSALHRKLKSLNVNYTQDSGASSFEQDNTKPAEQAEAAADSVAELAQEVAEGAQKSSKQSASS